MTPTYNILQAFWIWRKGRSDIGRSIEITYIERLGVSEWCSCGAMFNSADRNREIQLFSQTPCGFASFHHLIWFRKSFPWIYRLHTLALKSKESAIGLLVTEQFLSIISKLPSCWAKSQRIRIHWINTLKSVFQSNGKTKMTFKSDLRSKMQKSLNRQCLAIGNSIENCGKKCVERICQNAPDGP